MFSFCKLNKKHKMFEDYFLEDSVLFDRNKLIALLSVIVNDAFERRKNLDMYAKLAKTC